MHIVCIHAHPDDAEILAGGTLALLAELGQQITIMTMTAGDCGSSTLGRGEISVIRKSEASASAALIRAEYLCAGFEDLAIFNDDRSRREVTGFLRDLRPDIVLTASPSDYLCDHEVASELVRDACFAASVPNYSTRVHKHHFEQSHIYTSWILSVRWIELVKSLSLTLRSNIASSLKTKRAMLAKHENQRAWLDQQHGLADYLVQMERWTSGCGERAGIAFGESFRQYKIHPYPEEPALQRILAAYLAEGSS